MGHSSGEPLRLGRIGYLNVLPIYHPLETGIIHHPFQIVSGTPAHLNRLMSEGNLDLSVVSSIEYARHPERYFILPDLSISCCGEVKSVLLLSRFPVEELAGRRVLVTMQSATSVALLKVLFRARLGIEADFQPGSCSDALREGQFPEAFLAIGDEALQLRSHRDYPFRWDLGEVWHQWTGLPFVFALWVVQRKAVERCNGHMEAAIATLAGARVWGRDHIDIICQRAAQSGILTVEELRGYYEALRFSLGEGEKQGLELFFRHLVHIGEISHSPRLEIYSPLACVA